MVDEQKIAKPEQGKHWCYKCRTFSAYVFTFRKLMDRWSKYVCRNCGHTEVYYHYPKG